MAAEIFTLLALLIPAFALPFAPAVVTVRLLCSGTLLYQYQCLSTAYSVVSVARLSPVIFSAQDHLTSELLRTL